MLRKNHQGIIFYEFSLLEKCPIKHSVFTRIGGISKSPFDALNLGKSVDDHPEAIEYNRNQVREMFDKTKLVFVEQVHKDRVVEIHSEQDFYRADAMITNQKGIALAIQHADCQAGLFYDPENHALGMAHAGWRGLCMQIYTKVVEAMKRRYGSNPSKILACISPSLGPCHAEFVNYQKEFPSSLWKYKDEKNHFNLWQIANDELLALGLKQDHIEIAPICTYANAKEWFSYRRDRVTGRHATVAML